MANETFTLVQDDFNKLLAGMTKRGVDTENVLNQYVHSEAPQIIKPSMTELIPISDRNKKHARNSAPFGRQENFNLAVKLITSKEFNYLVFPDEGLGTSVNNAPQDFTGRGLDNVINQLIDEMTQRITENL